MEIDNLDIKISADLDNASKSIKGLIGDISTLSKALSTSLGTSNLTALSNAFKSLNQQTKGSSDKMKKSLETINQELLGKFGELGKDFTFSGDIKGLEGQINKYSNALETAKLKQSELLSMNKFNGKGYENATKDVFKYSNMLDSLKSQMASMTEFQPQWKSQSEFDEWYSKLHPEKVQEFTEAIKETVTPLSQMSEQIKNIPSSPLQNAVQNLDTGPLTENISMWERLKDVMNGFLDRMAEVKGKTENALVASGIKRYSDEFKSIQVEVEKTERKIATLNATLARERQLNSNFDSTTRYKRMTYDIDEAKAKLQELLEMQDKMEVAGTATQWNVTPSSTDTLTKLSQSFKMLDSGINKVIKGLSKLTH
jgi:uncharacterized protein YukE